MTAKHPFLRWLMISAGLGLFGPITWFVGQVFGANAPPYALEQVIRIVWPSSFWLMATDGIEGTRTAYAFVFLAIASNVILYSLLGSAAWWLKHLVAPRTR